MRYFIGRQGRQLGPFTDREIRDQLAMGAIGYDDLIWQEGMADWKPVRDLFSPAAPPPVPSSGTTGLPSFRSAVTREAQPAGPQLADRGKRLLAKSIDGILGMVLCVPALISFVGSLSRQIGLDGRPPSQADIVSDLVAAAALFVIPMMILLVVQAVLVTTRGQTLGKIWCKIRIVRTDGSPVGFVHGVLLRLIVIGLINNVVGITALIDPFFIFREDRRCLHDLIADTTVIEV